MLTLTCRTSGQPAIVNPLRLSSIVPHPDGAGSVIRTLESAWVPVFETTSEIAAMLQPAPEPAAAPEPDAAAQAAVLLRRVAEVFSRVPPMFSAPEIGTAMDGVLGLDDAGWEDTALALRSLAARLDRR